MLTCESTLLDEGFPFERQLPPDCLGSFGRSAIHSTVRTGIGRRQNASGSIMKKRLGFHQVFYTNGRLWTAGEFCTKRRPVRQVGALVVCRWHHRSS